MAAEVVCSLTPDEWHSIRCLVIVQNVMTSEKWRSMDIARFTNLRPVKQRITRRDCQSTNKITDCLLTKLVPFLALAWVTMAGSLSAQELTRESLARPQAAAYNNTTTTSPAQPN